MKEKNFIIIIAIACSLLLYGCVIYKYTVKGRAYVNEQSVSMVKVTISCPNNYPKFNSILSDDRGYFKLRGKGFPEGCNLLFDHPDLKAKRILIENKYSTDTGYPASLLYEIDVRMDRKE